MSSPFSAKQIQKNKSPRGFTVTELLVSIAIMLIITTMVVSNQKQFGSGAVLKNIVNNISLTLREAQIYGISVKQIGTHTANTTNAFSSGFGLHFNINATPTGDNTAYIFFVDKDPNLDPKVAPNPDNMYGSGISCPTVSTSECLDKIVLGQGHTVSDICTIRSGTEECFYNSLDITFKRPAVEASLIFDANQGNSSGLNVACVEISAPDGKKNSIVVYTTGQISIKGMSCTDAI